MKLPQVEKAIIEREKITDYLLNGSHPDNGGKAAFFQGCGFDSDEWQILADAFRRMAERNQVQMSMVSAYGQKYIVDGEIEAPNGQAPKVRTVWIVEEGLDGPRLVTAYPQDE